MPPWRSCGVPGWRSCGSSLFTASRLWPTPVSHPGLGNPFIRSGSRRDRPHCMPTPKFSHAGRYQNLPHPQVHRPVSSPPALPVVVVQPVGAVRVRLTPRRAEATVSQTAPIPCPTCRYVPWLAFLRLFARRRQDRTASSSAEALHQPDIHNGLELWGSRGQESRLRSSN